MSNGGIMQLLAYSSQDIFFPIINPNPKLNINLISSSFTPKKKYYCSICLDKNKTKIIKFNICKHKFHKSCIEEWIQNTNTCPLCRIKLE
jgi:hypothetical protein